MFAPFEYNEYSVWLLLFLSRLGGIMRPETTNTPLYYVTDVHVQKISRQNFIEKTHTHTPHVYLNLYFDNYNRSINSNIHIVHSVHTFKYARLLRKSI